MASSVSGLIQEGLQLHRNGALDDAKRRYLQALALDPGHAEAHYYVATVALQQADPVAAIESASRALALDPTQARAHRLVGEAMSRLGRFAEALASLDRAIAIAPETAAAHGARADVLLDLGRGEEAVAAYRRSLALQPESPGDWCNLGAALDKLGRYGEALASYDRALALQGDFAQAHFNRGNALERLGRNGEALACFDRALQVRPQWTQAMNNRALLMSRLGRHDEAVATFGAVIAMEPGNADALYNRGNALKEAGRMEEALADFVKALAIDPEHRYAISGRAECLLRLCDWSERDDIAAALDRAVADGSGIVNPFVFLMFSGDDALQRRCASRFFSDRYPVLPPPLDHSRARSNAKIRVAYLSADFQTHATAQLMAGLVERHDRSRFEIVGISFGLDDGSAMRSRLRGAFDEFHDVRDRTDREAAELIAGLGANIAVDLKGYTTGARFGILPHRPAPVQVSYLGYPGTMGVGFIDYIIADATILPFERQASYAEKIVHLPDSYQANDSTKRISDRIFTRAECDLPERAFVFCDFNNNYKITPGVFDIWMRLLHSIEGSVLWLLHDSAAAAANLRREAAARGIDPARLVFAARMGIEEHLARHRLADLFIDTLPCCAHTTASDALWAGLPVLTCPGRTFTGRVAASLLRAIGLPELVTDDLAGYEALALKLARDPQLLAQIRTKLAQNRGASPLFDTARFTRNIEAAYVSMWETWRRGEPPRAFAVAP